MGSLLIGNRSLSNMAVSIAQGWQKVKTFKRLFAGVAKRATYL